MTAARGHARRRFVALALVACTLAAGLVSVIAPPAVAEVTDGSVVHVTPFPLPEVANARRASVAPVTGADGVDYYLWEVRLVERARNGSWVDVPLARSDVTVTVRAGNGTARGTWSGPDAFAFAGDAHRVLVSVPATAARAGDDSFVTVHATAKGRAGAFNMLKNEVPPDLADALDAMPTSVRFTPESDGTFAFSVTVTITPTSAGYDVGVETLSPLVETTTLHTTHGSRDVTLDATRPVREAFAADPVGVVAETDATRFSYADRATFGDPVARFLLCLSTTPCQRSVQDVLTVQNVTGDAGASESPPGEALTYAWEWGDGATADSRRAEHAWARRGLFAVNLTVTDESGRSDEASIVVRVLNRDPAGHVVIAPEPVTRAGNTTFVAVATDPDGDIVEYTWFLDGHAPPVTSSAYDLVIPGSELSLGTHVVSVLVKDDAGGAAILTRTFDVVNVPPTAIGLANRTFVPPNVPVQFTDRSLDPDGDAVSWRWSFGDGAGSADRNPRHAYAREGVYVPSLTVTDRVLASSTMTLPAITVDGTAPRLSVDRPAVPSNGWFTSAVRVTPVAADEVTSSPTITARVNGGGARVVQDGAPFLVDVEGRNTVAVTATDQAGNAAHASLVVPVDRYAPSFTFEPPWPVATGTERLVVHAEDAGSGVARITLVLDQSTTLAVHEGEGPLEYRWDTSSVLPGRHVLTVLVDDHAGHRVTRGFNVITFGVRGVHLGPVLP